MSEKTTQEKLAAAGEALKGCGCLLTLGGMFLMALAVLMAVFLS